MLVKHLHPVVGQIEGDVRGMQEVLGEVFLHHVLLVSETDNEIIEPEFRIILHDMPENRLSADLHHRLRLQVTLFTDTRAEPSGQDNNFHSTNPLNILINTIFKQENRQVNFFLTERHRHVKPDLAAPDGNGLSAV